MAKQLCLLERRRSNCLAIHCAEDSISRYLWDFWSMWYRAGHYEWHYNRSCSLLLLFSLRPVELAFILTRSVVSRGIHEISVLKDEKKKRIPCAITVDLFAVGIMTYTHVQRGFSPVVNTGPYGMMMIAGYSHWGLLGHCYSTIVQIFSRSLFSLNFLWYLDRLGLKRSLETVLS